MSRFPTQRWQIAAPQPEQANHLSQVLQLHPLLSQVLLNRDIDTAEAAQVFLNPELQLLPSPLEEFEDLPIALELMLRAIAERQFIAICGDYDADGMTSTALLLRALRFLGATVDYAIPSRMQEGYGINQRIIEEFYQEGVGLILTVDNGIAAYDPIARARELGIAVIVTDHHDIPPTLPPANAILNPKLIREASPYRGVAGVGVAYILAICLAQSLQKTQDLTTPLIELFTLGTIADLAPLTGVNRRWVKRGLKLLPKSQITGVQALIQVAGLSNEKALKPEAIGFRLGPRINAIGRISDPQIVIELLTTDDEGRALELAMKCEQVNQLRQRLCELIEQEAIAWCTETRFNPQQSRVLVIVQPDWHHGVIGIVASRLVERYGVPVFIGTYEEADEETHQVIDDAPNEEPAVIEVEVEVTDEVVDGADVIDGTHRITAEVINLDGAQADAPNPLAQPTAQSTVKIRGSARGIPEFDVFEALQFCGDVLGKFGGHRAAGGFTLEADNLEAFRLRLEEFAHQSLPPECLKPLVRIDAKARFCDLNLELYERLDVLHPCGIENPDPVFWTADVHVLEQRTIGRDQAHLKVTLAEAGDVSTSLRAIAWRWGQYYPLPDRIDVAYRLRLNEWNGTQSLELELVGVRPANSNGVPVAHTVELANVELAHAVVSQARDATSSKRITQSSPISQPQRSLENIAESNGTLESNGAGNHIAESNGTLESNGVIESNSTIESNVTVDHDDNNISCFDMNLILNSARTASNQIEFFYSKRKYTGGVYQDGSTRELRISNLEGQLLIIQPERRCGFLGQIGEAIKPIDVSQPHYFNLVRSALMALELVEKHQLIQEKDQLLAAKDQQIAMLNDQLERLQQQLSQISQVEIAQLSEQIAEQEQLETLTAQVIEQIIADESLEVPPLAASRSTKADDPKQRLKAELGESIWNCLDLRSQKDLVAAYKKYAAIQTNAPDDSIDYSDVGLRLCSVIEREVIQPFFKQLHQFLLANDEPCEIGGVALRLRKKYTLGMLPPLLAAEWRSFQEDALSCSTSLTHEALYTPVAAAQIDPNDRDTVQVFLCQWEHPLAYWLQNQTAASSVAQIDKLLTVAADAENPLYDWQFQLLQALIMGNAEQPGILQQIYGSKRN